MFRENVLIALTILITILTLSFVILMTVYLQIGELDRKMSAYDNFSKGEEQGRMLITTVTIHDNNDDAGEARKHQALIKRVEAHWGDMDVKESNIGDEPEMKYENPIPYRPYVINMDNELQSPDKAADHNDSGGIQSGEDQLNDQLRSAAIFNELLVRIQDYRIQKRIQEMEERIGLMDGINRIRPWYAGGPFLGAGTPYKKDTLHEAILPLLEPTNDNKEKQYNIGDEEENGDH